MQYKVNPIHLTSEFGQKPHFWLFGSFKNPFLRFLNDPLWPGNLPECWRTFSSIRICNIKSIGHTKVKKMTQNLIFGSLNHSKIRFWSFWMILYDLATLPNVGEHLVLSEFAISSRLDTPKSRKWPKTSFLALWIIQKSVFEVFEWSFMTWQPCRMLENI